MVKTGTLRERMINSTDGIHKPMASKTATVSLAASCGCVTNYYLRDWNARKRKTFLIALVFPELNFRWKSGCCFMVGTSMIASSIRCNRHLVVFATDESQRVRIVTDTGSSPKRFVTDTGFSLKSLLFYYILMDSIFKPVQGKSSVGRV
jgi:hypothetical protein